MADPEPSWKISNGIGRPNLLQKSMTEGLLLANCSIVDIGDGTAPPAIRKGKHIMIQSKRMQYIGPTPLIPPEMVDVGGRFVMPGLCDAHVHVLSIATSSRQLSEMHPSLAIAKGIKLLEHMLLRGFTTVRDCGGCDCGLAQFSEEEIASAVEEASNCGKYVSAHAYTPLAVKRALELGVRSIEHGNCVDEECCMLMKERGAFFVPTLVSYDCCHRLGAVYGMEPLVVAKTGNLLNEAKRALAIADSKGVKICFGSDLPGGSLHDYQLEEFLLRSAVQKPDAILRSATTTCAELFGMAGEIGVIREGAFADLLVLEKNPLEDISVLADPSNMRMILKEGKIVKAKNLKSRLEDCGRRIIRYFED